MRTLYRDGKPCRLIPDFVSDVYDKNNFRRRAILRLPNWYATLMTILYKFKAHVNLMKPSQLLTRYSLRKGYLYFQIPYDQITADLLSYI